MDAKATRPKSDRLKTYADKRDFARTREPVASVEEGSDWQFVVQKHDARRLHYDLRLALGGALLSWAVPQGPSLVAGEKRLAVRTEDHPMKYLDFEGVIPKGEYGGGTMIVWDRGRWIPAADPHKGLAKGHLDFTLEGQRLKGRWHLVRMKPRPREKTEQWLLIKASDEHERSAVDPDILEKETTSLLSGKTNDELAAAGEVRPDHEARQAVAVGREAPLPDVRGLPGAQKRLLRNFVEPALAATAKEPPGGPRWLHEVKFDGYRLQARIDGGDVKLLTRKGLDWTHRFPTIAAAIKALALPSALLDGEIVVEDSAGISRFSYLVSDLHAGRQDRFRYYVFDLLYLDGTDLQKVSFVERKVALKQIFAVTPADGSIALSETFEIEGKTFLEHAARLGLEGMVSKRKDSPYTSGRTDLWLKSKCVERQEFVVIGYVPSTTVRRAVGSLVLGYYQGGGLIYAGRAGSGLSGDEAHQLAGALEAMRLDKPALARPPIEGAEKGVRWVEPKLVVEVEYRGWSKDGVLWQATLQGVREDLDSREITLEERATKAKTAGIKMATLTHPDRLLWPQEGITKQGLADFYAEICDWILPHLTGRPLSLVRCPEGVAADCFFAKHPWAGLGRGVARVDVGEDEPMLVIDGLEGLFELAQASVLEIHPWGSSVADLDCPDRLVFDLDPGEGVPWTAVIEAALEIRRRLADHGLESFVKTTGGKGLHVVVPVLPAVAWDPAKAFCKSLADAMAADSPRRYVANMAKRLRKGLIFIDYIRNSRGATAVGAYSTRARPGATVSTPLAWDELSEAVKADHYRLDNLPRRLRFLKDDPWAEISRLRQRLPLATS